MFFTYTVPVPNIPGKISRQKTKSGTYIHFVLRRQYDPVKKHTIPVRTMIGKFAPDDGQMYPNDKYFECFPEERTITSNRALRPTPNLSTPFAPAQ